MPWVLQVAVDAPAHSGLGHSLSYASAQPHEPGRLVWVPLGKRQVLGLVCACSPAEPGPRELGVPELKTVQDSLEAVPPLGEAWMSLLAFAARYYQRAFGEVALGALPSALRSVKPQSPQRRLGRLRPPSPDLEAEVRTPDLSAEQAQVLSTLTQDTRPTLLHGATGSGKTEVYLRATAQVLAQGKQVLVLVPEINLTPQLEARFTERFPGKVLSTLHSHLTPPQRLRHWLLAHQGQADVVLGTRLAVLASMPRLGLVVVDEEHDASYKSQDGARYSARDLAVWRAHREAIPIILGSATPSLESWQHAQAGRYRLQTMAARMGGGRMPRVRLVDMNLEPKQLGHSTVLSRPLLQAIEQRLARGEQSMLFLNRRGYAPVLFCGECGWKSACPHCSAWRVFHKQDRTLRCHHCGETQRVPPACPDCGNPDISPLGRGTERLEEVLAGQLKRPDGSPARVARIDADSTRLKGSLQAQLQAVHAGEVDVLVGTQMITKGHDFRRITLVAAVDADAALFSSDFRAAERLLATLLQAAGRAGRDAAQAQASEMWVQTWHPGHAVFEALRRNDYPGFAQAQLAEREGAGLPPYAHLALLRAEAKTAQAAERFLRRAVQALREDPEASGPWAEVMAYPPVPTSVARVAGVERMQLLLEARSRPALQRLLALWGPHLHALRNEARGPQARILRWALDVDPLAI